MEPPAHPTTTLSLLQERPPSGGLRVLVADDNPLSAELVRDYLELSGYCVDCAADGLQAMEMASTGRYGLLVLDVNMPRMDGVEVVLHLRHLMAAGALRVIVLTADRFGRRHAELVAAGVDGYLTKPVRVEKLDGEINRLLAG